MDGVDLGTAFGLNESFFWCVEIESEKREEKSETKEDFFHTISITYRQRDLKLAWLDRGGRVQLK